MNRNELRFLLPTLTIWCGRQWYRTIAVDYENHFDRSARTEYCTILLQDVNHPKIQTTAHVIQYDEMVLRQCQRGCIFIVRSHL